MSETATRATLTGAGEHLAAVLRLGDDYTNAEYIREIEAAREAGAGELYADRVLGVDVDALLRGVEQDDGDAIVRAAESSLRRRGVDPRTATYREYADAFVEASA
ncbi:MAG: hypothetical protein ACJ75G_07680 [Gaiellaceae bacterium]